MMKEIDENNVHLCFGHTMICGDTSNQNSSKDIESNFEGNAMDLIEHFIGKTPFLIAGKTGAGKTELINYLRLKYTEVDFVPELMTQDHIQRFKGNLVSEIHITFLYKNKDILGDCSGVYCYVDKDRKFHVKELDLDNLTDDELLEKQISKEQVDEAVQRYLDEVGIG